MSEKSLIEAAKAPVVAYGKKDWEGLRSVLPAEYRYEEVGTGRTMTGVEEVLAGFQAWKKALPDSKATIDNAFAAENTVVLELTWRGHQTGPLQTPDGEIPPSGRAVELRACQVVEMEDGRPVVTRHYFDMQTLLQQIGVTGRTETLTH